ncbi:glycine cleavage system protein GcvH [Blattabacterium cuenoti]|uniref:glycine cleavage system protein GcvH n=1 Tax=Blattabacterium cuenoti TaxID=1653831 RepID=UPI001EEC3BB4|nr:glycine cleavage system protein GcvH [Blattabacterium cuenoti]
MFDKKIMDNYSSNRRYSKNHEWIIRNNHENNIAFIGITDFAQKELGDIVYLDIDESIIGKSINEGKVFGTIEAVKTVSDLFMPISGLILEYNNNLSSEPELINNSPYEKGWILKIKILNKKEYDYLLSLEEYKKYIGSIMS